MPEGAMPEERMLEDAIPEVFIVESSESEVDISESADEASSDMENNARQSAIQKNANQPQPKRPRVQRPLDIAPARKFAHQEPELTVDLKQLESPYAIADFCCGAAGGFSAAARRYAVQPKMVLMRLCLVSDSKLTVSTHKPTQSLFLCILLDAVMRLEGTQDLDRQLFVLCCESP